MSTFLITKDLIKGFCAKGLTVPKMAEEVTKISGQDCSVNLIRKAAKYYKIDLRSKPQTSAFSFEEILEDNTTEGSEVNAEEVTKEEEVVA